MYLKYIVDNKFILNYNIKLGFPVDLDSKTFAGNVGDQVQSLQREESLGPEESLEKDMATSPVFLPRESHGQWHWWATVLEIAKRQT